MGWQGANKGYPSSEAGTYTVCGASCCEVRIDVLTGDWRVDKIDVVIDLGNQMNAAVDIGQTQGAIVLALSYLFAENVMFDENNVLLTAGTWEYKPFTAYDIPVEMNVNLLKDSPNPAAIAYGSKAVAEAPMGLVNSAYLALKNAIYAARVEVGHPDEWLQLDVPAPVQQIGLAIDVPVTELKYEE